ncbi:Heavy metal-associated isoprenylated plant protein [Quillaja saponaria]|uniref:Heavy metal-associated isoprenylated plant protein n=1 Tax=Quillaja saponaria TaxID=32244 RepID=A0AAD7LKB4_QUISA|nr:Heavy metal-associated isoprenylated plant protein [Quillaja saponaria]
MSEEAKQEQAKAEAKPKEKVAEGNKEEKTEEKPAEEKKEEPKPPQPFVLFVDLHCVGCAKKIERSIRKIRGVEGVAIDMSKNEVTIKGIVEHQEVCKKIMKKTKRRAKVLSPLPAVEGEPMPEVITSQVGGLATVELNVNVHCEACAEQLKKKILKMRGVQTAVTELSTSKVIVTGTMDANKLVEYVYRRTKKQARIVPQPEPQPEPEPEKKEETKEAGKPAEEPKPEEKKEENAKKKEEEKPAEAEEKKEEGKDKENKEEKVGEESKVEEKKIEEIENVYNIDEEHMKRMMYYYQPLYVIERIPPAPDLLFSDENPNACCIS